MTLCVCVCLACTAPHSLLVLRQLGELDQKTKEDLCASFQRRAVGQLVTRARRACQWGKDRLGSDISSIVRFAPAMCSSQLSCRMTYCGAGAMATGCLWRCRREHVPSSRDGADRDRGGRASRVPACSALHGQRRHGRVGWARASPQRHAQRPGHCALHASVAARHAGASVEFLKGSIIRW